MKEQRKFLLRWRILQLYLKSRHDQERLQARYRGGCRYWQGPGTRDSHQDNRDDEDTGWPVIRTDNRLAISSVRNPEGLSLNL